MGAGRDRINEGIIAYSQDDTHDTKDVFFFSSVVQWHRVKPFHSTDHVRPFPHENKLIEGGAKTSAIGWNARKR